MGHDLVLPPALRAALNVPLDTRPFDRRVEVDRARAMAAALRWSLDSETKMTWIWDAIAALEQEATP